MNIKVKHGLYFLILIALVACRQSDDNDPIIAPEGKPTTLEFCSFNIQFLGNSKLRDHAGLAQLLADKDCDLVVVQELVAPPDLRLLKGSPYYQTQNLPNFPNTTTPIKPSELATEFFMQMEAAGFDGFTLSNSDTGPGVKNQNNGSATEWFVTFYKTQKFDVAEDIPSGFLSEDLTASADWDRAPYAFSFRTKDKNFDFVLISVHLRPGAGSANQARRQHELSSIVGWIQSQETVSSERDYIILGDMNIESAKELKIILPTELTSLNTEAKLMTNTNLTGPKPYDHVMLSKTNTTEVETENNLEIINLITEMQAYWNLDAALYPGINYNHNIFRSYYSDHHPIRFKVDVPENDDD